MTLEMPILTGAPASIVTVVNPAFPYVTAPPVLLVLSSSPQAATPMASNATSAIIQAHLEPNPLFLNCFPP